MIVFFVRNPAVKLGGPVILARTSAGGTTGRSSWHCRRRSSMGLGSMLLPMHSGASSERAKPRCKFMPADASTRSSVYRTFSVTELTPHRPQLQTGSSPSKIPHLPTIDEKPNSRSFRPLEFQAARHFQHPARNMPLPLLCELMPFHRQIRILLTGSFVRITPSGGAHPINLSHDSVRF